MLRTRVILAAVGMTVALSMLITHPAQAQVRRAVPGAEPGDLSTTPPEDEALDLVDEEESAEADPRRNAEIVASRLEREGPMFLLEDPAIQEELEITEEQLAKLQTANEMLTQRRNEVRDKLRQQQGGRGQPAQAQGGRGGPGGQAGPGGGFVGPGGGFVGPGGFGPGGAVDPGVSREQMNQILRVMRQESNKALASLLTSEQRKRLSEISFQSQGPLVVAKEEVQQQLRLQLSQRQQIAMVMRDMENRQRQNRDAIAQLTRQARGDGNRRGRVRFNDEQRAQMDLIRAQGETNEKETIARIGKIMTSSQHKSYTTMRGETFDFTRLTTALGRAGGRGGQPGGGEDGPTTRDPGGIAAPGTEVEDEDAVEAEDAEDEAAEGPATPIRRRIGGN